MVFSISHISSTVANCFPYVSPTSNSDIIFLLVTFFSIVLLIPLYTTFRNPSIFTPLKDNWNFSRLDKLTLAASIDDNDTVRIIILLTYTYSLFAYYLLFQFCTQMSQYEYDTQEQYIDRFVSKHTVIIRGINTEIGTEEAKKKTQKLFQ